MIFVFFLSKLFKIKISQDFSVNFSFTLIDNSTTPIEIKIDPSLSNELLIILIDVEK